MIGGVHCTEYLGTIIFTRGSSCQLTCAPLNGYAQVAINKQTIESFYESEPCDQTIQRLTCQLFLCKFKKKLTFLNVVLILAGFLPSDHNIQSIPRFCSIHDKNNILRPFTVLYIRGKRQFYFPVLRWTQPKPQKDLKHNSN